MTDRKFERQAAEECTSPLTTAHHGGGPGRPFWNVQSLQFMYAPAFLFPTVPGCGRYRYEAVDEKGESHTFEAERADALLCPIWGEIPEGLVTLKVTGLNEDGTEYLPVGLRTFFKTASFPADLPPAARPYGEAAAKAYAYAMEQSYISHWATHGTPDPAYDLNVYPSKITSAVITGMCAYAKLCPEKKEEALRVARAAADWLISITFGADSSLNGAPPTYYINFRPEPEKQRNLAARNRMDWLMCIYPASVGHAYLALEELCGEEKYLKAALGVGRFYADHVCENGSWPLVLSVATGKPLVQNYCDPTEPICSFLMKLFRRTGEDLWKRLADGGLAYVEKQVLKTYEWEGQFEDSVCSCNYSNLTHYGADALIRFYCTYRREDEECMKAAEELMRFSEDQFLIWKRPAPWKRLEGVDPAGYSTPAGLEQYAYHVPIDASTADIMLSFLALYKAGRGELYLEKARALADKITRVQNDSGMIPTHWMTKENLAGAGFWLNCMFVSTGALAEMAEFDRKAE